MNCKDNYSLFYIDVTPVDMFCMQDKRVSLPVGHVEGGRIGSSECRVTQRLSAMIGGYTNHGTTKEKKQRQPHVVT